MGFPKAEAREQWGHNCPESLSQAKWRHCPALASVELCSACGLPLPQPEWLVTK